MSDELHYLRSILGNLREVRSAIPDGPSLVGEVLADNIDWLDCYIDARERKQSDTAAFLDRMAHRMETLWVEHGVSDKKAAADCRAMAEKLRK